MTYQMYIGSNNKTNKLELAKIEAILSEYHEGFTLQRATGYWHGQRESSAVVLLSDSKHKVLNTINVLKEALHQEAIAWHEVTPLQFT